jgi:hypothetical protein
MWSHKSHFDWCLTFDRIYDAGHLLCSPWAFLLSLANSTSRCYYAVFEQYLVTVVEDTLQYLCFSEDYAH